MKCKAACSGLSAAAIQALDSLRPLIVDRVIGPHLHRPGISSAGFYVQKSDLADDATHEPFCEVRLSGVSLADDRSYDDFIKARGQLEIIYKEVLSQHIKEDVSLFVILMLDGSPKSGKSPLIEGDEVVVTAA